MLGGGQIWNQLRVIIIYSIFCCYGCLEWCGRVERELKVMSYFWCDHGLVFEGVNN